MTPEELNRTIEFIIQSQARLAAAQEQDRQDRIESEQGRVKFEEWSKGISSQVAQLLDWQSQRLDRADTLHDELLKELREFRTETAEFQKQSISLLNLILERLPWRPITA